MVRLSEHFPKENMANRHAKVLSITNHQWNANQTTMDYHLTYLLE